MIIDEQIKEHFHQLCSLPIIHKFNSDYGEDSRVDDFEWNRWSTQVLNLFDKIFGQKSPYFINFKKICDEFIYSEIQMEQAKGVFDAAMFDYTNGYVNNMRSIISAELFGDFINLAKKSLHENYKDVAAVLSCAALEDVLKQYAQKNGLSIEDKDLTQVVNSLKSGGLVSGAQKSLLEVMPKIRNYAMHANWDKITDADVNSVIGFVEQFLLSNF